MEPSRINRATGRCMIALSLIAFLTVLTGYFQKPLPDEGTAAHIFQLSIMLVAPVILVFLATVDWRQPGRGLRPLAVSGAALALAFGALYYLEHIYYPGHYH